MSKKTIDMTMNTDKETQLLDNSRRRFMKTAAYASALSMTEVSNLAMAMDKSSTVLPTCDIHLLPTQNTGSETLSLFNHTNARVTIDSIEKVNLDNKNQFLAVKVNKLDAKSEQASVTLEPGETMQFKVSAMSSDYQTYSSENAASQLPNVLAGQLKVNSDHQAFNGMIPVTIFDSKVA